MPSLKESLKVMLVKTLNGIVRISAAAAGPPANARARFTPTVLKKVLLPDIVEPVTMTTSPVIKPSEILSETKIPDATPGIIVKYALDDEQALLAKLRYNRLIDIFTGLTCYSLQNHLRTFVSGMGQVETDEIYIGIDRRGVHYIVTVQAKGGPDKLGIVQIEQDFALCGEKFPGLVCRPVASQFMENDLIAMFEFEETPEGVKVLLEKHFRLVSPEDLSNEELEAYKKRLPDQ